MTRHVLALSLLCRIAAGAVPTTITYTGRLTIEDARATGPHDIVFRLCTSSGGPCPWQEAHEAVPVTDGLFAVVLGGQQPIDAATVATAGFLQIEVDGKALAPRVPLRAAPYALRAATAETAEVADTLTPAAGGAFAPAGHDHPFSCPEGQTIEAIEDDGTARCAPLGGVTSVGVGLGLIRGGTDSDPEVAVDWSVFGACPPEQQVVGVDDATGALECAQDPDIGVVEVGTGLTGGGTVGFVPLGIDDEALQRRVTGTCPAGAFVSAFEIDGNVACAARAAGDGIAASGDDLAALLAPLGQDRGEEPRLARADHGHGDRYVPRAWFSGKVLLFLGACPTGWSEVEELRGRFPRGWDGATAGQTGGSAEHGHTMDAAIAHAHTVDAPVAATTTDGSHAHSITTNQPCSFGCGASGHGWAADNGFDGVWHTTDPGGSHAHTIDVPATTSAAAGVASAPTAVASNLPAHRTLVFCRLDEAAP